MEYNWERHFDNRWIGKYAPILGRIDRVIDYEDYLDLIGYLKELRKTTDTTEKNAVAALAYLIVRDSRPWISIDYFTETSLLNRHSVIEEIETVSQVYEPDIESPEDFLDRMYPRLSRDEVESSHYILYQLPDDLKEARSNDTVVGAAMHIGFGFELTDANIEEYLGDSIPRKVRETAEYIKHNGSVNVDIARTSTYESRRDWV